MTDELLTFDEKEHIYRYDGKTVISVTQVLADIGTYTGVSKSTLEQAAERGTAIHQAIELYSKFEIIEIEEEYRSYLEQYIKFAKSFKFRPLHNELKLYSKTHNYAGTVDAVGEMILPTGIAVLPVDFKTTSKYYYGKTGLQLAAYRQLLRENGINCNGALMLWLQGNNYKPLIYTDEQLDEYFQHFKTLLEAKKIIKFYSEEK